MARGQAGTGSSRWLGLPGRQAVAAVLFAILLIGFLLLTAWQVVARRAEYFQRRDLHALANVGTDIDNVTAALHQAAALHFDPGAMTFVLSPTTQCLVGRIEVPSGDSGSISIQYQFVDASRSKQWVERLAEEDDRVLAAKSNGSTISTSTSSTSTATTTNSTTTTSNTPNGKNAPTLSENEPPSVRMLGIRRCQLLRPMGRQLVNSVTLDEKGLKVEQSYRLTMLLSPIVRKAGDTGQAVTKVKEVLLAAATAQLDRNAVATTPRGTEPLDKPADLARDSIDSAFASNSIGISATASNVPIGSRELDKSFDAIALYGPATGTGSSSPQRHVLWRIGEVPPLLEHRDIAAADRTLAGFIGSAKSGGSGTATQGSGAEKLAPAGGSVARIGNLVVYQRDYVSYDGLNCPLDTPCKLVAVREAASFDREVRKLDGMQATWLLIGVLTVIALLPLLQVVLGKRLDALPRAGQYGLWLALSLLIADAAVAAFTLWSTNASLVEGQNRANALLDKAQADFARELGASVKRVAAIGDRLASIDIDRYGDEQPIFPMPRALNCSWPRQRANTMFIESVTPFDGGGSAKLDRPRWHTQKTPAFGASIAGRTYLRLAKAGDFSTVDGDRFRIDQVYSRPDGQPKTILLVPPLPQHPPATLPPLVGDAGQGPIDCEPGIDYAKPGADYRQDRRPEIAGTYSVATGVLRTFLFFKPQAGFRYAVIDPTVVHGPNVLFHSEPEAELTDRLQDDIDNPRQFDQAVRSAREPSIDASIAKAGFSVDTSYQAKPVRLWVRRLNPNLDWVIVIIEDRSQAGFALWREAMTGYAVWAVAMLLAGLVMILFIATDRESLDRSPGMWLWPQRVLEDWTPQYAADLACMTQIRDAPRRMAAHLALTLFLFVGLFLSNGPARILLALTVTAHAAAVRGAFHGVLARNPVRGKMRDRVVGGIVAFTAFATLVAAILTTATTDAKYSASHVGTILVFPILFALLALVHGIILARARIRPAEDPTGAVRKRWQALIAHAPRRVLRFAEGVRQFGHGLILPGRWWAVALLLACAAPPIAGFLDACEANRYWSAIADRERLDADVNAVSLKVRGLGRSLEDGGELAWQPCRGHPELKDRCPFEPWPLISWTARAVRWLGLERAAVEASRTPAPVWSGVGPAQIEGVLPLLLLGIALLAFRKHYFTTSPPRLIATKALTRENVARQMLKWIREDADKKVAVASRRYLVVGAEEEIEASAVLANPLNRIRMFNLLNDTAPLTHAQARGCDAVVIYNFDVAMLEWRSCTRALNAIEQLARQQSEKPTKGFGSLFLLATTEPLDRIVFSRAMEENEEEDAQNVALTPAVAVAGANASSGATVAAQPVEPGGSLEVRWAALLRPFALRTVQLPPPADLAADSDPALHLFRRELQALGGPAADRVLANVPDFPERVSDNDVIAFVADNLAEQYRMMWETSTADEQVILYYLARGAHLKMQDSFALRSLLLRRLIVRTPEYRLVNRSFRRFIASVGNPRDVRDQALRATDGTDKIWPLLRLPLAALVVLASGVLAIVAPDGIGAAAIVPAITASLPALWSSWLRPRTAG